MLRKTKYGLLAPAEQPASRDQGEEAGPQENQGGGTGDSRWWWRAIGSRARAIGSRTRAIGSRARAIGSRTRAIGSRARGRVQLEDGEEDRIVVRRVGRGDPDLGVALLQETRDAVQFVVGDGRVAQRRLPRPTEGIRRIGRAVS